MISPGISKNTDRSEKNIALIRQIAISLPIPYCMNIIAISPPTVVSELEQISGIALERATISASLISNALCSSLYLLQKMIA